MLHMEWKTWVQALLRKVEFIQILVFDKMEIGMDVFLSLNTQRDFLQRKFHFYLALELHM